MKRLFLSYLIGAICLCVHAQRHEIGGLVGTSFYLGDLNPKTLFAQPQLAGGLIYRYNITPRWAVKANLLFAKVQASDYANNKSYERNLSFKSPITEISAQLEFHFFKLYNSSGNNRFSPYMFLGLSLFSFNPQADLDGITYELNHLGTEGQGFPGEKKYYSLVNAALPFGLGFKVNIGKYISCGIEWGMRYTFTDYLDDVGDRYFDNLLLAEHRGAVTATLADRSEVLHKTGMQRGNNKTKDWYSFAGGFVTFKIGNDSGRTCNVKNHHSVRKKVNRKRHDVKSHHSFRKKLGKKNK